MPQGAAAKRLLRRKGVITMGGGSGMTEFFRKAGEGVRTASKEGVVPAIKKGIIYKQINALRQLPAARQEAERAHTRAYNASQRLNYAPRRKKR